MLMLAIIIVVAIATVNWHTDVAIIHIIFEIVGVSIRTVQRLLEKMSSDGVVFEFSQ